MEEYIFAFGCAGVIILIMTYVILMAIQWPKCRQLVESYLRTKGYRPIRIEQQPFGTSLFPYDDRPRFDLVAEAPTGQILRGGAYVGRRPQDLWALTKRVVVYWQGELPMYDSEVDASGPTKSDRPTTPPRDRESEGEAKAYG